MKVFIIRDLFKGCTDTDALDPGRHLQRSLTDLQIDTRVFSHNELVNESSLLRCANKGINILTGGRGPCIDPCREADAKLLREIKSYQPDIVIAVHGLYVRRHVLQAVHRIVPRVKLVNWFPDNIFECSELFEAIQEYDIFYVKDSYQLSKLRCCGCRNASYLPEAAYSGGDPNDFVASAEEVKSFACDLGMVGSIYLYRLYLFEALRGLDLKVWGDSYGITDPNLLKQSYAYQCHQGFPVYGKKAYAAWRLAKININPMHPTTCIHGTNQRAYELASARAFQLVEYTPDLENQFVIGAEIECFRTPEELRKKAEFYLQHDALRERIAAAGFERVKKEHTYGHRVQKIINDLGLS